MALLRSSNAPAVVVFVDLGTMVSFDQLASSLRHRGVEVVHLTVADNLLARLASRVIYHRTARYSTTAELLAALQGVDTARVVDIQCPEFLLDDVVAAARLSGVPRAVLTELEHRFAWRDKFLVARRLAAAAIPVPGMETLEDTGEQQVLERLGLPLVVKDRVGSGGEGVRIVRSAERFTPAREELGGPTAHLYAEEFLAGETLCFATAIVDGHAATPVVYRTRQGREAEGASTVIEVVEDEQVRELGCRVAELVGGSGLLNLDLVRGEDGSPRVVDVNLRAWHSVVALGQLGHDYVGDYLRGLGVAPGAQPAHHTRTGQISVFPDFTDLDPGQDVGTAVRLFAAGLLRNRRLLPPRYLALQVVLFARRLAARRG